MFLTDFPYIIFWWSLLFFLGALFFPLTARLFPAFLDRGYIFAKILGILVLSYLVWLLGILKILPFSQNGILLILSLVLFFSILSFIRNLSHLSNIKKLPINWKFLFFEELLFFLTFLFWSFVKAHQPDIIGLEKYMDFGFINSLLRSQYFPPLDMWLSQSPEYNGGFFINYYYFGHLVTAVLTKLSGLDPSITFNLMLATIFGLTFTGSFSLAINLINTFVSYGTSGWVTARRASQCVQHPDECRGMHAIGKSSWQDPPGGHNSSTSEESFGHLRGVFIASLLTAFLVTLAGNLHTLYAFFKSYIPFDKPVPFWQLPLQLNFSSYWYPNATRFIPFTIHEFPSYSFVVSDLHGHVLDIPFVLLTIALLLSFVLTSTQIGFQIKNSKLKIKNYNLKFKIFNLNFSLLTFNFALTFLPILGLVLAIMYMTNAWDGLIYFGLSGLVFLYQYLVTKNRNYLSCLRSQILLCKTIFYLLSFILVFSLPFHLTFKPFVFGIGLVADHSPLWMLLILWGFFYYCVAGFIFLLWKNRRRAGDLSKSDVFIILLILLSTTLIIFPEFFYIKDIYPAHYRANTMFKMGYQAFIMLSLASGYIMARIFSTKKSNLSNLTYKMILLVLLFLVSLYPYFSINSYFNGLKNYQGLYGLSYLAKNNPDDYQAIVWLNKNVSGQPALLEAVGDSYTEYARISANTGLPTVLGWPVHEWLWRGGFSEAGKRTEEVKNFYTTQNSQTALNFLKKYKVKYVIVGKLEEQKYPGLFEEKLKELGEIVFTWGKTKIYRIKSF